MKPLNEYPTPETDRQVSRTSQVPSPTAPEIVQADFARLLEQRLAMCQSALKASHDLMKQLKPLVDKTYKGVGDVFFECALEDNEKALTETAPQ